MGAAARAPHLEDLAVRLAGDEGAQEGQERLQGLAGPDQDDELDVLPEGPGEAPVGGHQQPCLHRVALGASAQADQQQDVWALHARQAA